MILGAQVRTPRTPQRVHGSSLTIMPPGRSHRMTARTQQKAEAAAPVEEAAAPPERSPEAERCRLCTKDMSGQKDRKVPETLPLHVLNSTYPMKCDTVKLCSTCYSNKVLALNKAWVSEKVSSRHHDPLCSQPSLPFRPCTLLCRLCCWLHRVFIACRYPPTNTSTPF